MNYEWYVIAGGKFALAKEKEKGKGKGKGSIIISFKNPLSEDLCLFTLQEDKDGSESRPVEALSKEDKEKLVKFFLKTNNKVSHLDLRSNLQLLNKWTLGAKNLDDSTWVDRRDYLFDHLSEKKIKASETLSLFLISQFVEIYTKKVFNFPLEVDRRDDLLTCFTRRFQLLKELFDRLYKKEIKNSLDLQKEESNNPLELQHIFEVFKAEMERFVSFLSETSFKGYQLPAHLHEFFGSNQKGNNEISIDNFIQELWKTFKDLKKKAKKFPYTEEGNYKAVNFDEEDLAVNLVENHFLPRFITQGSIVEELTASIISLPTKIRIWMNLQQPRLMASILIGLLPLLLSGDMYNWYVSIMTENITQRILFFSLTAVLFLIVPVYLSSEINKSLLLKTASNWEVWKRTFNVWIKGFIFSLILAALANVFFTRYMIESQQLHGCFTCELFITWHWPLILFQAVAAYFLGVVLQIIWEEKPITRPL